MDTKWKAVLSFGAFFVGVTLTLTVLYWAVVQTGITAISDAFQGSYLYTRQFEKLQSSLTAALKELALSDDPPMQADEAGLLDPDNRNILYYVYHENGWEESNIDREVLLAFFRGYTETETASGHNERDLFEGYPLVVTVDGTQLEEPAEIFILLAFAKDPLKSGYDYKNESGKLLYQDDFSRRLYRLTRNMWLVREQTFQALAALTAGLILLLASLLSWKQKRRGDAFLARLTGRLWLEAKLLLGLLLALPALSELIWNTPLIRVGILHSLFETISILPSCSVAVALPVLFWGCYFLVYDLRYNRAGNSLCRKAAEALRQKEQALPFSRRMALRENAMLASGVFFAALVLLAERSFLWSFVNELQNGHWDSALWSVPPMALWLAMLAVLFRCARQNKRAAREIGLLTGRIAAVRAGESETAPEYPKDGQLAQAARDLDTIGQGMQEALDRQLKSERMKVELITNVSHDLKTPLTSIISYVELLKQEETLPEHVRDYVRILDEKSRRLKTMVLDVFEVSKAASGQLPMKPEPLDLAKLLRQTLADMAEEIDAAPVSIRAALPQTPVTVTADGERLYRVYQNLLQNALRYSLDGSRVYVTLTADAERATVTVKNTSRDMLPPGKDFTERFVRGDESRADGGSGLGLSIARSFTEACGGAFGLETDADLFTAVTAFPLTPAPDLPRERETPAPEEQMIEEGSASL